MRLVQPSRASLRLWSTRLELWAFDWAYGGLQASRADQFSGHSGLMLKRCRFFPRSSLSRRVDLGCQTARSIGDPSLKDTAECVSGAPVRLG